MREIRRRAEAWSAAYHDAAAKSLAATSTTGGIEQQLSLVKISFINNIQMFYEQNVPESEMVAAVGLEPLASKIIALKAALASGPAGNIFAPTIAGGIVRAMSDLVITYFEDRE